MDDKSKTNNFEINKQETIQEDAFTHIDELKVHDADIFSKNSEDVGINENNVDTIEQDATVQNENFKEPKKILGNASNAQEKFEEAFPKRRFLPMHAKTYELEKYKKKGVIIFNHVYIRGYSIREGSHKDVKSLEDTFSKLGFDVEKHDDLEKDEVFRELNNFTQRCQNEDYGCIVVVVLTHGGSGGRLCACDQSYSELELLNHLAVRNNPGLAYMPRILIVQACRGKQSTKGCSTIPYVDNVSNTEECIEPYTLPPVEIDMLVFHSSFAGRPSYKDIRTGSWFIQALCRKINERAHIDHLEAILVAVKRQVAIDCQYRSFDMESEQININKQMPVVTSALTRDLYLLNYEGKSDGNNSYFGNKCVIL